jgi:pimeloyl-ACP methyl ester carboxylesterase
MINALLTLIKWLPALALVLGLSGLALVQLAPQAARDGLLHVARKVAGLAQKAVMLPDGTRIVYLQGGQGEPTLLLHGFGSNKDSFTPIARLLTGSHQLIVPDLPGFGASSKRLDASYAPVEQARRLHAFAQALGLTAFHLGGSSMGGQIAASYAALYPQEVKSLWLIDPAGLWNCGPSPVAEALKTGHNPLLIERVEDFPAFLSLVMSKPPYLPGPIMDVLARERIANLELERRIFNEIVQDTTRQRVRGLKVPTLIVWGEQDRIIAPSCGQAYMGLLPEARLTTLPGIGHSPQIEASAETARAYQAFRAGLR